MALLGYGLEKRTFRADEPLTLTLYWQCDAKLSEDYEVFVHIVKAKGQKPVAQGDSEPQDGLYPTSFWSVGEVIRDPELSPSTQLCRPAIISSRWECMIGPPGKGSPFLEKPTA